jgi:glutamate-1-semialdehyde 2,1-aminomutase
MTRCADLFSRAQKVLPGGVSRNILLRDPNPHYVKEGRGCRIVDIDGHETIDFANNMASLVHGHAHPAIVEAVTAQLQRGSAFTMATEAEIQFAEHLCSRSAIFDKVRFMNSGTEAVMAGMKAARAFTDRPRIAKVEGSYHGAYDYAEVSQSSDPTSWGEAHRPASVANAIGTPEKVLSDVVILPFNNPEVALAILEDHKDEIACVLVDLTPHRVGMLPASPEFVAALGEWTSTHGAVLLFDEVITFRNGYGGMQERYDTKPDLTTMGKMIGGGFPVGALAGSDEVMSVFTPGGKGPRLPYSGTFSANPITMTAGRVAMELYDAEAVERLNRLGDLARERIAEAIKIADAPMSVTGSGSLFRIHIKAETPTDYRSAFVTEEEKAIRTRFIDDVYQAGVLLIYSGGGVLSTVMDEAEIDRMAEAVLNGARNLLM